MESAPKVAVVIPTRNRETRVAFALEAIGAQTLPRDQFEVVVVRDSSQAGPFAKPPEGLTVRYLTYSGSSGPTAKRNVGWRSTTAPLVAFTDDDCRPAPDWLERMIQAEEDGTFLTGRTEPDPDEIHLLRGLARSRTVVGPSEWYPCCNVAYPRAMLDRLDGFDESFYFGGEDTDLALRARKAGARAQYVHEALVWHAVLSRTLIDAFREAVAWPSLPLVISRHPEQRRHLYLSFFRNEAHAKLALAVLGSAALRARPAFALAMWLPYLAHHLRSELHTPSPVPVKLARGSLRLPSLLLVELVEMAATARAAWRHRVAVA
ncbi:MAG: hypothetical protein QOI31_2350 [Solirubrobacterales bacterium]|jgi:GT2 family glycosyltransferase|nr:hypothetical protein [Solirubrobacterales bacterium]